MSVFSENLKEIRKKTGLNQFDFASLIGLDVTKKKIATRISNWEKGRGIPDIQIIINIANAGKVSLDWLFLGVDSNYRIQQLIEENLVLKDQLKNLKEDFNKEKIVLNRVAEQLQDYKNK